MNSNRLIIADDFGFNKANDLAMLDLCSLKKIDGVSIFPKYISESHARSLMLLRKSHNIKIGLHVNLTLDDYKNCLITREKLLMRSIFNSIDKDFISREFNLQLKIFKKKFGHDPDFIDGHEHVHAFPRITKIVCKILYTNKYKGFVRYVGSNSKRVFWRSIKYNFFLKFITLEILALNQKKILQQCKLLFNHSFDGLIPSNSSSKLLEILKEIYNSKNQESTLVMCHPGIHLHTSKNSFFTSKDREIEKNFLDKWQ